MFRRTFLQLSGLAAGAAPQAASSFEPAPIDFRYAPVDRQATFCFPDDPHKSLAGQDGDLRYGHVRGQNTHYFPLVIRFGLNGMEPDQVAWQKLEAPGVPIVHTRIDRQEAILHLTAFATNRPGEGRVDNVLLEIRPRSRAEVLAGATLALETREKLELKQRGPFAAIEEVRNAGGSLLVLTDLPAARLRDTGRGYLLAGDTAAARAGAPLRYLVRVPQQEQSADKLEAGLREPDALLEEARAYWNSWRPFGGPVGWKLPRVYNDFLVACARNIQQARERREGRLTFQVGPTVYRGLWVVDGHFLLEAARYLGYDSEAQQGLETTWAGQGADGGIFAGGGKEHWKDTGIAMFSMVRQGELAQDWSYLTRMQAALEKAAGFLASMRERARAEGSSLGRYGLLAKGFGDGGIGGGLREEFTNTLWALAGLKATASAAGRAGLEGLPTAKRLYGELGPALFQAARREMRRHAQGFEYLPMLLAADPSWQQTDPLKQERPQVGQWALAHSIYPGVLFERTDPVVRGYVALMQACTQEDVPVETGWIPREGLWNYDACFAAHAYLWAGERDWALRTFHGFLNHATPLYCWREEQALRGALIHNPIVGDMPHNWASAECVLFLRHMLALEDGPSLRLLAGINDAALGFREPFEVTASPTRFGRVDLRLEPAGKGWRLSYRRGGGPAPAAVELPERLGSRLKFQGVEGATARVGQGSVALPPTAASWEARWE